MTEGDRLADVGAELQLVLDELRREGGAVGQRAHVLGAVDDDQVAAGIDEAGVAGVEPAVGIDDLAGGLVVLEVALEDARALDQHLAAVADLHVDARARPTGRRRIGLGVGLQRDQPGELGGAVHLLEVHADRAEEAEGVGAQRRAAGVGPARAQQAELVPHRAVDEELAERGHAGEGRAGRTCPRARRISARSAAAHERSNTQRLSRRRIRGAHLHAGEHVLPDAGRGQHRGGPELAQVALHRLRALRAVHREPDHQVHDEGVERVTHPGHRQIGQPVVVQPDVLGLDERVAGLDHVGVRQHGALGRAGGAGRVGEERDIVQPALVDLGLEVARDARRRSAARAPRPRRARGGPRSGTADMPRESS